MTRERQHAARFAHVLASLPTDDPVMGRFCEASRLMLHADGAAITMGYAQPERLTVSATSELARSIEDAQEVVGQGPAFDALTTGDVVVARFGGDDATTWPALEDSLARLRFVGTVLTVPVTLAHRPLGVFTAHDARIGWDADVDIARYLSRVLGPVLGDHLSPDAIETELGDDWSARAVINQATGMLLFHLGISAGDALTLLRAHAYARESTLLELATLVVDRDLELDDLSIEGQ